MSDLSTRLLFDAGVIKFNHRKIGYPDAVKIAQEWAKDPSFHELMVRGVSMINYGIQFVYVFEVTKDYTKNKRITPFQKKYLTPLLEKYHENFEKGDSKQEKSIFAWDISFHNDLEDIFVLKNVTY